MVVGGKPDQHERSVASKTFVRLSTRFWAGRRDDGLMGSAEVLNEPNRILLRGVDDVRRAKLAGHLELGVVDVDGDDLGPCSP